MTLSESADFAHHKKEFELFQQTISEHVCIKDLHVLDLCAQFGRHLGFIINDGAIVTGCDIIDYNKYLGKDSKYKIIEYYNKYGINLSYQSFDLTRMDAQVLAFGNSSFDVVFCMNAFEHVPDPEKMLQEIYRVLKHNGYAFISFIPVYFSDTGSHMSEFVKEPWAHLRFSEEEFIVKLKSETPDTDYWVNEFKHGINKRSREYFINLFEKYSRKRGFLGRLRHKSYFDILKRHEWIGVEDNRYLQHENFKILLEKYTREDLLFRGMYILLKKI